jgi:predicted RNA methylase
MDDDDVATVAAVVDLSAPAGVAGFVASHPSASNAAITRVPRMADLLSVVGILL